MEEIKVNDYVRLDRNQGIRKIVEIEDDCYYLDEEIADEWRETAYAIRKEDLDEEVLKHSENIIDLIEVGDIVEVSDVLHNDIVYIWNEKMLKALKEDIKIGIGIKSIVRINNLIL